MKKTLVVLIGAGAIGICLGGDLKEGLNAQQLAAVAAGETVVTSKDLPQEAWPELTLYRLIKAPPETVKNLLLDYKSAPSYTPGMLAAEVVAEPSPEVKDVRYTVRMPVVSKISYVVRNTYRTRGKEFSVKWDLVESPVASASRGALEVQPEGKDSLLRYTNHVTPSLPMAGVLKSQALKEAKTTIEAIGAEAERRAGAR